MGAVRPRPTIICTKLRRLRRPALTWVINSLSPDSSMGILRSVRGQGLRGVISRCSYGRSAVTERWRLYKLGSPWCQGGLGLAVPVGEPPERHVPARELHALEPGGGRRDAVTPHDGNDDDVLDHEIVHLDEERRPLDRIHLAFGGPKDPVVLLVAPAGDVPPLPLVLLGGRLPRGELVHEVLRVGCAHGRVVHLDISVEVR